MIYKRLDSNDIVFLDTDESSDTDFGEQKDDAVLPDFGDNSSVDDTAYVSDNNRQLCQMTINF
jgi:hypothetical protein